MDHITVTPPSERDVEKSSEEIALEKLRSLDEDWEFVSDWDKRNTLRRAISILSND